MAVVDINAAGPERTTVAQRLSQGDIVLLRNIDAIRHFRTVLDAYTQSLSGADTDDLAAFYEQGVSPSMPTILAMSRALKRVRTDRFLSRCLAPLIHDMGFGAPVRLDGGIPRIVLPAAVVQAARESGLFTSEDFKKLRADGPTEVFMAAPANVHRDYNRQHYLLQCNMWFPLHDADEDEVLRIYPDCYRRPVYDMDPTANNLKTLGDPLRFRLGLGDAILFHGEHLHTSPPITGNFRRRHSYDLRIASHAYDDTRHYRDCFLDLRNFATHASAIEHFDEPRAAADDDCALPALLEVEQSTAPGEQDLIRLNDAFDRFPFAEDRYLILAQRAAPISAATAARALRTVIDRSPLWFWTAVAAQGLVALRDTERATAGFRKASDLAGRQVTMPNFMPIAYNHPPTQPMPQFIRQFCDQALAQLTSGT